MPLREYTDRYIEAFREDAAALGLEPPEEMPRATDDENIAAMGADHRGARGATATPTAATGRSTSRSRRLPDYGKLARLDHSGIKSGARVDSDKYEKDDARDFVLWKATQAGRADAGIPASARAVRAGTSSARRWRCGCSASRRSIIHAGGVDLIFPHHENEIAQSEGATGKPFSRFWVHVEHLMIEEESEPSEKMSKSLGNVYNLEDVVDRGFRPSALRYLYLGVHYRKQLKFSWAAMAQAEEALKRLTDFLGAPRPRCQSATPNPERRPPGWTRRGGRSASTSPPT